MTCVNKHRGFNQNNSFGHELFLFNLSEIVVGEEAVLLPLTIQLLNNIYSKKVSLTVLPPSHHVYCRKTMQKQHLGCKGDKSVYWQYNKTNLNLPF